ncbi:hypothetical protein [Acholeplasma laidlawii]|uniref:hypothetical protein n=1 Tax=Acholeplasma laidlawii TaxID=2148 RepID=UPI0021F6BFBD|nr:hypothetical protein [Acholeplasma laidlawii]
MKDKGLTKAFMMFIVSLITLASAAFAWFSTSSQNKIGQIIGQTADYSAILVFDVKKGDDLDYTSIETIDEMHEFFGNTVPNDRIHFKIDIENNGNKDFKADLVIRNIFSEVSYAGFNMLDVYYLEDGKITIVDVNEALPDEVITLPGDAAPPTVHDQVLNPYRFSYLVDGQNNLNILNQYDVPIGRSISVLFTIVYDENTSRTEYEGGIFHLNSIYIYLN